MRIVRAFALALVLLSAFEAGIGESRAEFHDPLVTPARPTERLTRAPMTAVVRASPTRLVAAGLRGVIAVSNDAGKTWKQAAVPVREDLTALAFPTPDHGWAVGNDGLLLETQDGGNTWTKRMDGNAAARLMLDKYERLAQQEPDNPAIAAALKESKSYQAEAPARPFLDVAFTDDETGYIGGNFNLLFRTRDGGKTWEPLYEKTDNPNGYNIYSIRAEGQEVFLLGELGLALRRDPQTDSFVRVPLSYEGTLFTLTGKDGDLIAAGLRGSAFRTTDGGSTWRKVDFGALKPATFSSGTVLDDGRIVLVTTAGELFVSSDGGATFRAVAEGDPTPYYGVAPAGKDTVALVGLQGIRMETLP